PAVHEPLDGIDVTDDSLFIALVAEFAAQRNQLETTVANYLALAERHRDLKIAKRATRVAMFARDDEAAFRAAKIWVDLEPQNQQARQALAAMYLRSGDSEGALAEIEHIVADTDDVDETLSLVISLLGRPEDLHAALEVMTYLVDRHTDNRDVLVAYALLAIRAERLTIAEDAMNRIMAGGELNANMALAYVTALQKQNRREDALQWLEKALDINPEQPGIRLIYARLLAQVGRFEEARLEFMLLAKDDPDNTDVLFALGLLNMQANRAPDARTNFERLLDLEIRTDEANFYLGQLAEIDEREEDALAYYRRTNGGNNYLGAQLRVAWILARQGNIAAARGHLNRVRTDSEEQEIALVRAEGEILTDHDQLQQAMAVYNEALGKYQDVDLLYNRAMLAERLGDLDKLEQDLRKILEIDSDNAQALNALGYTLADRTDRFEEALSLIERALKLSPTDFYILDSMGWVLYRLGRLDEAREFLRQALALRNDPEVAAHLGEVLWVLGEHASAREVWDSALRETPGAEQVLDAMQRLAP
ncbi:MAG: tetratricopeptide repeat protein, partial [Pseudomonadota bacterium]